MKNYTVFKNAYILIEDSTSKLQPFYKEYQNAIPNINLNSPLLCCPFSNARRSPHPKKINPNKAGYCEICYLKYENYMGHVESKEHKEYAEDTINYRNIDIFIKEMMENDYFDNTNFLNSPCEKLEASFANGNQIFYNNDSQADSLIVLCQESITETQEVVEFNIILNKIEKKYSQEK